MNTKICSKCKEEKPLSGFLLYKSGKLAGTYRSHCRKCSAAQVKDWTARNKARNLANQRRYYAANPKMSIRARMARYGKDEVWYLDRESEQGGVCAICGKHEVAKGKDGKLYRLAVDHNHKTGALRGLLCGHCNRQIATLERHDWLPRAMAYLAKHQLL